MSTQQPELNKDYVINSLTNQVANLSLGNAQKDSVIASQQEEIQRLEKELDELHAEKVAELDKQSDQSQTKKVVNKNENN